MAVQQNTNHIQTTHIGSLPRPHKLLDILKANMEDSPTTKRS
jgi:5-methyltetrahydropteroyltriglutamate--homocysteine methyltransferase